jgi:hypothetical protein
MTAFEARQKLRDVRRTKKDPGLILIALIHKSRGAW